MIVIKHVKKSINVIRQYKYLIKSTEAQLQNSDASFHSPPTHESAYINVQHLMNIMHPNIKVSLNKPNSAMYNKDIKYNSCFIKNLTNIDKLLWNLFTAPIFF